MKNINWKVRFKNPTFYVQLVLAILTPILAYTGLVFADLTEWSTIGNLLKEAYSNPYLLGLIAVSVFNASTDPTVSGLSDSVQALSYNKPKSNKEDNKDND